MPTYRPTDKMSTLITDNFNLLQVMCRFNIPLGFGDKTVQEVCQDSGVDCMTFLRIVNFTANGFARMQTNLNDISIPTLVHYLKASHDYFLNYAIPTNRQKLEAALPLTDKLSTLILKVYDQYAEEVNMHMNYEDHDIFTYIDGLLSGHLRQGFTITTFSQQHDEASDKLNELKNLIIKYYPGDQNNTPLIDALFDIYKNAEWLAAHCQVEDNILIPAIMKLERNLVQS